jgi:hypothetical protein
LRASGLTWAVIRFPFVYGDGDGPLENPWHPHVDSSLARSLGFQPTVRTVYQAVQEKLL